MAEHRFYKAKQILTAFLEAHPDSIHAQVHFTLANALVGTGNPQKALVHYRAAARDKPSDAAIWQNMGKAHYDLKHYAEAGDALARAHGLITPKSPDMAHQAAVAYILAGRPETARPLLENLVAGADGVPEPHWLEALLNVYLDLGREAKALPLARGLLRENGQHPGLWKILARLYIGRGEYLNAAAALEVHGALVAPAPEDMRLLGEIYTMAGVPAKAARYLEMLLLPEAPPEIYEKAAAAYFSARRPKRAVEVLQRGLEHHPSERLWRMLAGVYYKQKDYQKAYWAFKNSLRYQPDNPEALVMLGYCALQLNRVEAARSAFSQAARFPQQREQAQSMLEKMDRYDAVNHEGR
jgi:tetratricopeptide (TPR) repeat protein